MPQALIAVIDDDELVRMATASLIRAFGHRTLVYAAADDFLGADPQGVGCIVTDLEMPGRSGLDLARTLRGRGDATPVVMMTAYATPAARAAAAEAGIVTTLEKPLLPHALEAALATALR